MEIYYFLSRQLFDLSVKGDSRLLWTWGLHFFEIFRQFYQCEGFAHSIWNAFKRQSTLGAQIGS